MRTGTDSQNRFLDSCYHIFLPLLCKKQQKSNNSVCKIIVDVHYNLERKYKIL